MPGGGRPAVASIIDTSSGRGPAAISTGVRALTTPSTITMAIRIVAALASCATLAQTRPPMYAATSPSTPEPSAQPPGTSHEPGWKVREGPSVSHRSEKSAKSTAAMAI